MTRPAQARLWWTIRLRGGALLALLALAAGPLAGCIDTPEDACSAKKPCPSGLFCSTEGVCLLAEICGGSDEDGDKEFDEAPAANACVHPDHTRKCALNGTGCGCNDRYAFDVDDNPANGCEHAVVGDDLGGVGTEVESVRGAGPGVFEAFAVGGLGRVAWVRDEKVYLTRAPSSRVGRPITLGLPAETFVAQEGAELSLFELYVGDQSVAAPDDNQVFWALVAERARPDPALVLFVGGGVTALPGIPLKRSGATDYGAPSVAFVDLGDERYAIAVAAFGRASNENGAPAGPLLWIVPLRNGDEPLVGRAIEVDVVGAGNFRTNVAPIVQRGPTDGTLQLILVGVPERDVAGSEVLIKTFSLAVNGAGDGVMARSINSEQFVVDGTVTSHLGFPADAETMTPGLYLANLKDAGATGFNPLAIAGIGTDGGFVRSETEVDAQGQPAVSLDVVDLDAEALAFIGVGRDATQAACMPVLAPLGEPGSMKRQISLIMFGANQAQRADGLFDDATDISALRVSAYPGYGFWSAWIRSDAGGVSLRRGYAACR